MNCCENCFLSEEIKSIIKSLKNTGDCNFCNSSEVHVYNILEDFGLDERFNDILSIFKLASELSTYNYSQYKLISIKDEFEKNWSIFNNLSSNKIHEFLHVLLEKNYPDKLPFLSNQVGVLEWMNEQYLNDNSVLRGQSWSEFVQYIKHENRFHSKHINYTVLEEYLKRLTSTLDDDDFFRARISNKEELSLKKMGAPPKEFATAGRANSEGISHLYLASDTSTAISEIRPSKGDTIYVGKFPVRMPLKVVDFRILKKLDVFEFQDPVIYAINLETFNQMNKAISKPVRSGDSKLDYLPTQFIVDFIKSLNETIGAGYDGIVFESTVSTTGYNLMLFDPKIISCTRVEKRIIESLSYGHVEFQR
ncbi:RES family NAD+ phosphorylase [Paenibacillus massiliensis]|uniref:RES family NAD+ phosphorylase n=1 Tax=Paenibacillus massiliensis TaxID=225917 RepID=UPI00040D4C29|nr:RES family NAD+ phosphorylase [Paenibacillus massiliensis]